jgi:hypothetical protein
LSRLGERATTNCCFPLAQTARRALSRQPIAGESNRLLEEWAAEAAKQGGTAGISPVPCGMGFFYFMEVE